MATLISCVKCGHSISSEARTCPICKSDQQPKTCVVCKKQYPANEEFIGRACNTCADGYLRFSCPTCKSKEIFDYFRRAHYDYRGGSGHADCPSCGQSFEYSKCQICDLPVLISSAYTIPSSYVAGRDDYWSPNRHFHYSCRDAPPQQQKELCYAEAIRVLAEKRKKQRICVACGKKLGLLDGISAGKHKKCDSLPDDFISYTLTDDEKAFVKTALRNKGF